jgi:hypothetical protein
VTHHLLYRIDIRALLEVMGGKTVSQCMNAAAFRDSRCFFGIVIYFLSRLRRHVTGFVFREKQPLTRPIGAIVVSQQVQRSLSKNRIPVFSALSLFHANQHPFAFDVFGL